MKMCQSHWDDLKIALELRGLMGLVAKNGDVAMSQMVDQLNGEEGPESYDPLMAANFAIWGNALRLGGLYLMAEKDLCPICESEKNDAYPAEWWITNAADEQLARARKLGLVPPPS